MGSVPNRKDCRYSNLWVWNLVEYDRVLLLDVDVLSLRDASSLLELDFSEPISAAQDAVGDVFNSGVLLLRPDAGMSCDLYVKRLLLPSYNKGDQGYFNSLFGSH
jgi:glycogenin